MIAELVFALGAITTFLCAFLLLRRYAASGVRLLLWSGLCFGGLTLNNVILFVDLVVVPDITLFTIRLVIVAISMLLLLYGMIWDPE